MKQSWEGVVEEIMLDGLGRDFRFCGKLGQDQAQARTDEDQGTRVRLGCFSGDEWQCIRTSTQGRMSDDCERKLKLRKWCRWATRKQLEQQKRTSFCFWCSRHQCVWLS